MSASTASIANEISEPEIALCPFVVIVDTREQFPFAFRGLKTNAENKVQRPLLIPTKVATLQTGDYSIEGLQHLVACERKSAADLFGTLGVGRSRFEDELVRFSKMQFGCVIIESDWPRILSGVCPTCLGAGFVGGADGQSNGGEEIRVSLTLGELQRNASLPLSDFIREHTEYRKGPARCRDCQGSGHTPPNVRSKLSPKSVFRSVIAWQQRYPMVHWFACESRRFAEACCFRVLERFWQDHQKKLKGNSP